MTVRTFDETDVGVWVDGWWGIYAPAQVVILAIKAGWRPDYVNTEPLALATLAYGNYVPRSIADEALAAAHLGTFDGLDWGMVADEVLESSDEAILWLQERTATGLAWSWEEGSFGLWKIDED